MHEISIRYYFGQESPVKREIELQYMPSMRMVAGIFKKEVSKTRNQIFVRILRLSDLHAERKFW